MGKPKDTSLSDEAREDQREMVEAGKAGEDISDEEIVTTNLAVMEALEQEKRI